MEKFYSGKTLRVESLPLGVKRIVFTRPDVKNALNEEMIIELDQAVAKLAAITDCEEMRLLIISGEGSVFSAGADINYMREQSEKNESKSLADARKLGQLFYRLAFFPTPVVSVVQGAAIGGGLGFTAISDFVLADKNSVFATSEVTLGIVPGVISPYIVRKIGLGKAAPFMMSGKRLSADEALHAGLVSEVSENLERDFPRVMREFLASAPNAARRTKELLRKICPLPEPGLFEFTASSIASARVSDEGRTGLKCFLDKKPTPWALQLENLKK